MLNCSFICLPLLYPLNCYGRQLQICYTGVYKSIESITAIINNQPKVERHIIDMNQ